jgi:hypothetical protein
MLMEGLFKVAFHRAQQEECLVVAGVGYNSLGMIVEIQINEYVKIFMGCVILHP